MSINSKTVREIVTEAREAAAAADNAAQAAAAAAAAPAPEAAAADAAAEPAAETKGAATFKAFEVTDHGVIVGIGAVAENVDLDDEKLAKGALVTMAYDFCAGAQRTFKANHGDDLAADLVASWPGAPILKSGKVLAVGETVPEADPIVGISLAKGSETHWFVKVRPHDAAVVETARKGGLAGFSFGGWATKAEG